MATGVASWSQTAANNATADSAVNWAEGMAPSAVNDSARAMMASVAKWRDDLQGITTGGSSTAYTVTTSQTFASLGNLTLQTITIIPHATSGAAPTLSVDGLGAQNLRLVSGEAPPVGAFVAGTPYLVRYNNSVPEFIAYAASGITPIGAGMDFWGTTAPGGWLFCYGQAVSRTTYAALFAVLGTTYGSGDGSTTFNLPDKRGRGSAGKDDMGGSSANRLTNQTGGLNGDTLGATGGSETHTLQINQMPAHDHGGATGNPTTSPTSGRQYSGSSQAYASGANSAGDNFALPNHVHTIASQGGDGAHNNVQPTIIANYIIRAL
jgi:microcystin-dependent protein